MLVNATLSQTETLPEKGRACGNQPAKIRCRVWAASDTLVLDLETIGGIMKIGSIGIYASLVALPAMAISGSPPTADSRAAIQKVIDAEDAAWEAGDATAFCDAALPDVVFTNIIGMFSVGIEPMKAQHARIFSTIYKGSKVSQTITNVKWVRPDVAIVDTLTSVTGFNQLPPGAEPIGGALRTRLEQVMVFEGGRWRVASFHNVTINPAANAPPK